MPNRIPCLGRSVAPALALSLLIPAAALAQDAPGPGAWPSADELRRDLQSIGYEFAYDPGGLVAIPEYQPQLPRMWTLTEPSVEGDTMPDGVTLEPFTLKIVDDGSGQAQLLFAGASTDAGQGEYPIIATTLMEVGARLPAGNGLEAAVWFIGNKWTNTPGAAERSTDPCFYQETEDAVLLVWFGGEDQAATSFFGTAGPGTVLPDELELCKATLAQGAATETPAAATGDRTAAASTQPAEGVVDTVPPEAAVALIEAGGHIIIDVRTPEEYQQAHIVGAINIDVEAPDFAERIAELDPDEPYLLYCQSGRRSGLAAQQMAAAGFTDLTDAAGLADLARAGAPVE